LSDRSGTQRGRGSKKSGQYEQFSRRQVCGGLIEARREVFDALGGRHLGVVRQEEAAQLWKRKKTEENGMIRRRGGAQGKGEQAWREKAYVGGRRPSA
jgi:hypothetical protein